MLTRQLIEKLTKIVGKENLVLNAQQQGDAPAPDGTLFPSSVQQVSEIVTLAARNNVLILPQGNGTRPHADIDFRKTIALSTLKLDRVLDLDEKSLKVTLQAGVSLHDLKKTVAEEGLVFPAYPWSFEASTVGGCAANGTGGPASLKHGVFKQYVLGMEVVLPSGNTARIGGQTVKNVVGYDLTSLFCGSEGSLGVITAITMRLLPKPPDQRLLVVAYGSTENACAAMGEIVLKGTVPDRMAMLDSWGNGEMDSLCPKWAGRDSDAVILVQMEGLSEVVATHGACILTMLEKRGGRLLLDESDLKESERIWRAQGRVLRRIHDARVDLVTWDMVVPRSESVPMMKKMKQCAAKHGVLLIHGGYYGNGVFHPVALRKAEDEGFEEKANRAFLDLKGFALSVGGNAAGPFRALGIEKAKFIDPLQAPLSSVISGIKDSLDAKGIMKPLLLF